MKNKNRILVLLLTVALMFSSICLPVDAAVSTTSLSGAPGSVVTIEYTYTNYAGISGELTYSNSGIFSSIEVYVPGLMGEYKPSTGKIAFFGMSDGDVTVNVVLTIADNATAGSSSTVDFHYKLANKKGESLPYADEDTVTVTVTPKLDYSVLLELINTARGLNSREYTAKTWAVLEKALEDAEKAQEAQTQAEINDAAAALDNAIRGLEKLPNPPSVDYDELLKQIRVAEGLTEKDYTASSWSNLKSALSKAKAAKNSTSQSEIDAAATALKNAIAALVPVSSSSGVDYSELNKQIAIAEGLSEKDYTPESWSALDSAYIAAISARTSSSQTTVDKAANALSKAISNLVRVANAVDYTELKKQITIAEGLEPSKYSNVSFDELTSALEAARQALSATTQEEVDTATENLKTAIANLKEMQLNALLAAIQAVKDHITNEKLAQLWKELYEILDRVEAALVSGDQDEVDACTVQLQTYLDAINKELEALRAADIVEIEKVVEIEPTDDYCNIPAHRIWIVLFWVSLALNIALCGLIAFYFIKKSKTGDNTPLVDYDISDDSE